MDFLLHLGACDIAPMASVDGVYVGPLEPGDVDQLLDDVRRGRPVLPDKQLAVRPVADPHANSRDWPAPAPQGADQRATAGKAIPTVDRWVVFNAVAMVAATAPIVWFFGWWPVAYLFLSTIFSLGVHPVGARWVQEHFVFREGQETYSYYGPLNKLSFNVGYHNEHHDVITVPWSRLPQVRRTAPEFYEGLQSYQSWTSLLLRFVRDRNITLYNYIVRPSRD